MTDHQHTADVLNRAADLIEERGWVQGPVGWSADGGPVCVLGSLGAASGARIIDGNYCAWELVEHAAVRALAHHLNIPEYEIGAEGQSIYAWNDAHNRTAAEVIEVLRATAVIEQDRGRQHTATDTGYDTTAAMRSVADDAAARTLAGLR